MDLPLARMWAWEHLKAETAASMDMHLALIEKAAQFIMNGLPTPSATPAKASPVPMWRWRLIEDLPLSIRARNVFRNEGFITTGVIDDATDAELLRLPNLGRGTLREVRHVIDEIKRQEPFA